MRYIRTFFLSTLLSSPVWAEGPLFQQKEPSLQQEMENIYQNLRSSALTSHSNSKCIDDPTLCVDAVNHRVGIGTSAPSAYIDIYSGGVEISSMDTSGNWYGKSITVTTGTAVTAFLVLGSSLGANNVLYRWPSADGSSNQVLSTNGSKSLSWNSLSTNTAGSGSYIYNQPTLQAGATAYPAYLNVGSSGTIYGPLTIAGIITANATAITTSGGNLDATKLTNNVPQSSLTNGVVNTNTSLTGGGNLSSTLTLAVSPSSGTLQGNTFNGNSQLTQTTSTGLLQLTAGSKSGPTYSYSGATGYGQYQSGTTLGLTTNGHNALVMNDSGNALQIYSNDVVVSSVDASGDIFGAAVLVSPGSAASPTYTFKGSTNYGMHYNGGTQLILDTNAHKSIVMDDGGATDFYVTGVSRLELSDALFNPLTDNQMSLGNSTKRWSDFRAMKETISGKVILSEPDTQTITISTTGHINVSGTAPTPSSCGAAPSPTMAAGSTDVSGTVNVGGGVVLACTITFFDPFVTNPPTCIVTDSSTGVTPAITSLSGAAMTVGFSATIGGGKIYYICMGSDN